MFIPALTRVNKHFSGSDVNNLPTPTPSPSPSPSPSLPSSSPFDDAWGSVYTVVL